MKTSIYCIIIALIVPLASGCSAEKRLIKLLERYPQPTHIDTIPGETIYLSRDVPVYIPGDSIRDSIPFPVYVNVPDTSITLKTANATFTAYTKNNTLYAEVYQPDSTFIIPVDSAIQKSTPDTLYERPPPLIKEVKVKSKVLPYLISACIVEFLLLVILLFLIIKTKR